MPIPLPNLDDLTFDELVAEGKRLIPGLAPGWTDHNPSDPGIAFIELFAFIAEMLMYRANTVNDADKRVFVKLLRGGQPGWPPQDYTEKPLDAEIRDAVLRLREEERAVTAGDFLRHALNFQEGLDFPKGSVARAHCLRGFPWVDDSSRANVTVLVVPGAQVGDSKVSSLLAKVLGDLQRRSPLTTRLFVDKPSYVPVTVHLDVHVFPDQIETTITTKILDVLKTFFNDLQGGTEGTGWPFGRAVYVSDLYALIDGIPGVDYITAPPASEPIQADGPNNRRIETDNANHTRTLVGIKLQPNELVSFLAGGSTINIKRQVMPLPEE